MTTFHPDLALGRFIPSLSMSPRLLKLMGDAKPKVPPVPDDMTIEDVQAGSVSLRVYRPKSLTGRAPALLWIHGGGFLNGSPEQDERSSTDFARELGITVISLRYRLGPANPSPAAVEDAYAGLLYTFAHEGVDPSRVAIGGASAGGGLAASLALYAHDKGGVAPVFQLLVYPMLDDRTVTRTDHNTRGVRVWTTGSNRFGWTSYLGHEPGLPTASVYAAPARREDLSGLPPAWIGVGTLDLFFDEDVAYAKRLLDAGVPCDTTIIPGAFHGFDAIFPNKPVSREFWSEQARVLRAALLD